MGQQIARIRGQLAHRYVDTSQAIVASTLAGGLPQLEAVLDRLRP